MRLLLLFLFFFFTDTAPTEIYTLSLHDALPISVRVEALERDVGRRGALVRFRARERLDRLRSEEHTSELQSPCNLVCRLLLEKKKKKTIHTMNKNNIDSTTRKEKDDTRTTSDKK